MSEIERTIYLGKTEHGEYVWAELRLGHKPGETTTIYHEQVDGVDRISTSFVVADRSFRGDPYRFANEPELMSSRRFDNCVSSMGQTPPEERVIAERSNSVTVESLAFIEEAAVRWHLNDVRAACAHMPDFDDIVVPDDYVGGRHDYSEQSRKQGWAIKNVVCSEGTDYRWGTSWLTEVPPADVVERFRKLIG